MNQENDNKIVNIDNLASIKLTVTQASKISKVTRQAIHVAIKKGRLRACKENTCWMIELKDLEEYRRNRYSRQYSQLDGDLIFDNQKGYYSVRDVAKMLGISAQHIYHALRSGKLPSFRRGAAWVIHVKDALAYRLNHLLPLYISQCGTD